jgi:A predicted alpha-helical domain with a conserved ER motif.
MSRPTSAASPRRFGTWVLPGGLTRVALRLGSLVVNSSQGGGSLLRSAAGYHAYRRLHAASTTPSRVAGFVLLNEAFPRSAHHARFVTGYLYRPEDRHGGFPSGHLGMRVEVEVTAAGGAIKAPKTAARTRRPRAAG